MTTFAKGALEPGFWLETANQAACELAATAGYKFVLFDMEHGIISFKDLDYLVPFCRGMGLVAYARAACAERLPIQQALDTGIDGIIIPQIENLAHAKAASTLTKYPPLGTRGMGYGRATAYGQVTPDLPERDNKRVGCYIMIETAGALADVDAIAALDTVDGLFMGPSDLSLSRGFGVYKGTNTDLAAVRTVAKAAQANDKAWGLPAMGEKALRLGKELDAHFVTVSSDRAAIAVGAKTHLDFTRSITQA